MFLLLLALTILSHITVYADEQKENKFPDNFIFGAATASYQIEGAWNTGGKGENIWDRCTHTQPNKFLNHSTGDIACDSYHKYEEDVKLLKDLGVSFYRFSIAWSRILPTGKNNIINQEGIDYYNKLINELLKNGIQPYVTIFHWDTPQPLEDEGGWINKDMIHFYSDYAKVLFERFGDRVKHWITFNEITQICEAGYENESKAPFRKIHGFGAYWCGHIVLLAHGKVYRMYENEFKSKQKGTVGIALDASWREPKNSSSETDIEASNIFLQMNYGWFMNPIINGIYPKLMIERVKEISEHQGFKKSRLPLFTSEEQLMLKGSFDFLGLNHYTTSYVTLGKQDNNDKPYYWADIGVNTFFDPSWPPTAGDWFKVVPWGFRKLLVWLKNQYGNPPLLITENGYAGEADEGLIDDKRVQYYKDYLTELLKAIQEDGCNVFGYTAWSLLDNFEWTEGYTQRYGLFHVNFDDPNRNRTQKASAIFYKNVVEHKHLNFNFNISSNIHV